MDIINMDHSSRGGKKMFEEIKRSGPKLVPFAISLCLYFGLWLPTSSPSWFSALLKCLPALCLAVFVLARGFSAGRSRPYSRNILVGLLISFVGDIFLNWADQGFFDHGVVTFGLVHLCYTLAMGIRPLMPGLALLMFLASGGLLALLWPCLPSTATIPLAVYSAALALMSWRAVARWWRPPQGGARGSASAAMGAVLFIVSDFALALDRFCSPLPHGRLAVMATYYLAQMLIAISVLDQADPDSLWKRN
ncbi:lysoplasmalogenase-like protein TMEM86A [Amblyraja radiata]|uniref:lysoplasmalogenase-like protein TMEM86A n=1 Tax=Amblyraja radiata TaxID=386614 RepID=UPI001403C5DF|nr:lysoplasmalogenase-like protein TMEM86A [Amblyraja radiata]